MPKITQEYMNQFFSTPHKKGNRINFTRTPFQFLATKGKEPHKKGSTIVYSLKNRNEAPLSIANLKKLLTHRRNTSPKQGQMVRRGITNLNSIRRKILMTVNNKHFVKFYANNPKYVNVNIPVPMRNSFKRSINNYEKKRAR
jgi:hypothetical protein